MMLIEVSHRDGVKIIKKDNWVELNNIMDEMIVEYEKNNLMLIEEKLTPLQSRTCDFATTEEGWDCALIIVEGEAKLYI